MSINIKPGLIKFLKDHSSIDFKSDEGSINKEIYTLIIEPKENLDLLTNLVFSNEFDEELMITESSINHLREGGAIEFIRIYDSEKILYSYESFIETFLESEIIDFID